MPETGTQIVPCEDVRYTNTYEFVDRLTNCSRMNFATYMNLVIINTCVECRRLWEYRLGVVRSSTIM